MRAGDRGAADTMSPIVPSEFAFAPRWYVPRADVAAAGLAPTELQTSCPYKGIASHYDIDATKNAGWSYRAPFDDMAAIGDLVSFEPTASRSPSTASASISSRGRTSSRRHRPQPRHRRGRRNDGRRRRRFLTTN